MNGQCLVFAKELAAAFGTNRIAVHHHTQTSEELEWDEERDDFARDEDGEEIFEEYENLHHAYAVAPDGSYWDGGGKAELHEIEMMYRGSISEYSTDDAYARYSGFVTEQNEEFSRSLIRPVLLAENTKNKREFKAPKPKTFFSVTTKKNLDKIQKDGLQPVANKRAKELGDESKVFLFDSRPAVVKALVGWLGDEYGDEELVLLSTPSSAVGSSAPSFDSPEGSWEWSTSEGISPENLTVEPDKL